MYAPQLGRFISRDPIGYVDGENMYAALESNPLSALDPSGTDAGWAKRGNDPWGETSIIRTDPLTGKDYQYTGVQFCRGYIAGDALFDTIPAHYFLVTSAGSYGLYANSHTGGPPDSSGGVGVIWTKGKVRTDDLSFYPPATSINPPAGTVYSICEQIWVEVSDKSCSIADFDKGVQDFINQSIQQQRNMDFSVPFYDCRVWGLDALGRGLYCGQNNGAAGDVSDPELRGSQLRARLPGLGSTLHQVD